MKHLGDITKLNGAEIPVVDCITGGSPCQDLSVAGKRAGLDGERSGLFMEQIRIVKEMRKKEMENGRTAESVRPRWMVWENVPGAFSSNGGKDFQAVLTEIVRIVEPECADVPMPKDGKWSKAGFLYDELGRWSIAWRVHDAQFWGVPQRRKRIALVADFGGLSAPEVLFERKGLSGDSEPGKATGQETAGATGGGVESASGAISFQERAGKPGGGKGILIQHEHTGALSTLNNQSVLQSAEPSCLVLNDQGGSVMGVSEDVTGALRAQEHGHQPVVAQSAEPIPINTMVGTSDTAETRTTFGVGEPGDPQFTISAAHEHAVMVPDVAHSLKAKANCDFREDSETYPVQNSIVRRLTPLECERLQGYPDGWTDIGEWTDTKGKKHKEADSPRYKALGNSIALPFWFYLLRRISATYERPATFGSLFDGIGGFPLCWERCNGKGTAIWASEIEEFPIAVTKIRFPEEGGNEYV